MPEYFIAYHGRKMPENLEEHMGKFMGWVGGLGKAVVMPGMPLGQAKIVSADGVSDEGGSYGGRTCGPLIRRGQVLLSGKLREIFLCPKCVEMGLQRFLRSVGWGECKIHGHQWLRPFD